LCYPQIIDFSHFGHFSLNSPPNLVIPESFWTAFNRFIQRRRNCEDPSSGSREISKFLPSDRFFGLVTHPVTHTTTPDCFSPFSRTYFASRPSGTRYQAGLCLHLLPSCWGCNCAHYLLIHNLNKVNQSKVLLPWVLCTECLPVALCDLLSVHCTSYSGTVRREIGLAGLQLPPLQIFI
jgi:hypothetical protein